MGDLAKLLILEAYWFGELSIMAISVALACGRWRQEGHCKFQASQGSNITRLHPKKERRKEEGRVLGLG